MTRRLTRAAAGTNGGHWTEHEAGYAHFSGFESTRSARGCQVEGVGR